MMTETMISNDLAERRIYKVNRTGPRTDPCDTPNGRCCGQDNEPDMLMLWYLSEKYVIVHVVNYIIVYLEKSRFGRVELFICRL